MALLAQYTIRSKQAYIFRTNAMREISGASALIRDVWDLLFAKAEEADVKTRRIHLKEDFPEDPDAAFEDGTGMVELFEGGGNETVLIRDQETYQKVNGVFTRALLEDCPGMIPLCVAVPASRDYPEDYRKLMAKADAEKNRMRPGRNMAMAPFSMLNRTTLQPISILRKRKNEVQEFSAESWAKLKKADKDPRITEKNALLDQISESREEKHLLAVVHADGNNMGVKIQKLLKGRKNYTDCVRLMRAFTRDTAAAFSVNAKKAMDDYAAMKSKEAESKKVTDEYIVRWIVSDGDDATFVCNAKHALELTRIYLRAVSEQQGIPDDTGEAFRYSSCAGICVFHSHYPFSIAYTLAESACDLAKKKVHAAEGQKIREEAWVDWTIVRSGIQTDAEELRKEQGTEDRMARPWAAVLENMARDGIHSLERLDLLTKQIRENLGISRTNIKSIGLAWEKDETEGRRELHRLNWRTNQKLGKCLQDFENEDAMLRAIYDCSEIYDLWYAEQYQDETEEDDLQMEGSEI